VTTIDDRIDWRCKGFPAADTSVAEFVAAKPSLFDAGFSWPILALRESAIDHNVNVLASWCADRGISLAPHGKTTMAPALFEKQLAAGSWAMTAATPWQARAYRAFGVRRILLANELVDSSAVSWLVRELADPDFDFYCYVDSVEGATTLDHAARGAPRPLKVLVERGVAGGRTGVRSDDAARGVAERVRELPALSLVGVAGYEGPFGHGRDRETLDEVGNFAHGLGTLLESLDADGLLDEGADEFVLTCGGSGHVDVVTDALRRPINASRPVRAVLRAGSYVTHDDGLYARTSSLASSLRPAIEVWCQVLSRPEPGLALLGAGRRDVSFDSGLPVPLLRRDASGALAKLGGEVTKLNDQHAFLTVADEAPLDVADLVCLGISHPCTALDRWRLVPVLDDERRVVDCVRLYF
jgi:D-serine deaminase-like pyridoxal phosphate-dependent protein